MSDVLQDAQTAEFLEARWRDATTYGRQEILEAITEFYIDKTGSRLATEDDDDDFDDDGWDDEELEDEVRELKQRVQKIERQLLTVKPETVPPAA